MASWAGLWEVLILELALGMPEFLAKGEACEGEWMHLRLKLEFL